MEQCSKRYYALGYCNMHYKRMKYHGDLDHTKLQFLQPVDRFWSQVDKSGDHWLWTGAQRGTILRYGTLRWNGKYDGAHRVSWQIANGREVPPGLQVMHTCDIPLCVRPDHLTIGTHWDNNHDMWTKGRGVMPTARFKKLTSDQVEQIRTRRAAGEQGKELAAAFGVSQATVSMIVHRKRRTV